MSHSGPAGHAQLQNVGLEESRKAEDPSLGCSSDSVGRGLCRPFLAVSLHLLCRQIHLPVSIPEVLSLPMPSGEVLRQQANCSADKCEDPGLTSQRVGSGKGVEGALDSGGPEWSLNLPREETDITTQTQVLL